jgi:hypothetical protein
MYCEQIVEYTLRRSVKGLMDLVQWFLIMAQK